jgi:hypothetical protein
LCNNLDTLARDFARVEAGVGHDFDAALPERLLQFGGDLFVLYRNDARQQFDQRDI